MTQLQELSLQEGGTLSGGGTEYPREYPNLTPSQSGSTPKRTGVPHEKKEEGASSRGSQRGGVNYEFSPGGGSRGDKRSSGSYSKVQRGAEGNFMISPARSSTLGRPNEFSGGGFGHGFDRSGPRGGEGSGRSGRDQFYHRDYRDGLSGSYDNHEGYLRGHGFAASDFDRHPPYLHPDWRRSYAGGEFDHPSPYPGVRGMYPDIHHGVGGGRGVFDPHFRGNRFGGRRDRILMEEARLMRVKSHERMEHLGGGARLRPDEEFRDFPMEYYLSQPTTPHFPPERSLGFNMPPPPTGTTPQKTHVQV